MKKCIIMIIVFFVAVVPALADNSARIKELIEEGRQVWDRREQAAILQKQCEERICEIRGAIKELRTLDMPKPKKEEPKSIEKKGNL